MAQVELMHKLNNATQDERYTSGRCLIMYDLDSRIQFVRPENKGAYQQQGYTEYRPVVMPEIPALAGTVTEQPETEQEPEQQPAPALEPAKPKKPGRKKVSNEQV